jgi:hypothetical protein
MKKIEPSLVGADAGASGSLRVVVAAIVSLLSRRETHRACQTRVITRYAPADASGDYLLRSW